MGRDKANDKYMGSVKVGPKGQIVIPKEVRDMFGIESGDTLVLLADAKKGIAIERMDLFNKIVNEIFDGKGEKGNPEYDQEEKAGFTKKITNNSNNEAKEE